MFQFVHYRVSEFMTPDPVCVSPDTPLGALEALFEQRDFNSIPVCADDCRLRGMVTKLDFLKAFRFTPESIVPSYAAIMTHQVATIMTRTPVCMSPDTPLTRTLESMVELGVKSFPVVRGERLLGIITRTDLVRALRQATGGPGEDG